MEINKNRANKGKMMVIITNTPFITTQNAIQQSIRAQEIAYRKLNSYEKKTFIETFEKSGCDFQALTAENRALLTSIRHEIVSLDVSQIDPKKTSYETVFSFFQNLRRVSFARSSITSLPKLPNSLTELSLSWCSHLTDTAFHAATLPPNLTCLDLNGTGISCPKNLPKTLQVLLLDRNQIPGSQFAFSLPSNLKTLSIMSGNLSDLTALPSSLENLFLYHCPHMTSIALASLPKGLKKLLLESSPITFLPSLPQTLEELSLENCGHLTNEGLAAYPLPARLRKLSLKGTGISTLPDNLPPAVLITFYKHSALFSRYRLLTNDKMQLMSSALKPWQLVQAAVKKQESEVRALLQKTVTLTEIYTGNDYPEYKGVTYIEVLISTFGEEKTAELLAELPLTHPEIPKIPHLLLSKSKKICHDKLAQRVLKRVEPSQVSPALAPKPAQPAPIAALPHYYTFPLSNQFFPIFPLYPQPTNLTQPLPPLKITKPIEVPVEKKLPAKKKTVSKKPEKKISITYKNVLNLLQKKSAVLLTELQKSDTANRTLELFKTAIQKKDKTFVHTFCCSKELYNWAVQNNKNFATALLKELGKLKREALPNWYIELQLQDLQNAIESKNEKKTRELFALLGNPKKLNNGKTTFLAICEANMISLAKELLTEKWPFDPTLIDTKYKRQFSLLQEVFFSSLTVNENVHYRPLQHIDPAFIEACIASFDIHHQNAENLLIHLLHEQYGAFSREIDLVMNRPSKFKTAILKLINAVCGTKQKPEWWTRDVTLFFDILCECQETDCAVLVAKEFDVNEKPIDYLKKHHRTTNERYIRLPAKIISPLPPLLRATALKQKAVVRALLQNGAKVTETYKGKEYPDHYGKSFLESMISIFGEGIVTDLLAEIPLTNPEIPHIVQVLVEKSKRLCLTQLVTRIATQSNSENLLHAVRKAVAEVETPARKLCFQAVTENQLTLATHFLQFFDLTRHNRLNHNKTFLMEACERFPTNQDFLYAIINKGGLHMAHKDANDRFALSYLLDTTISLHPRVVQFLTTHGVPQEKLNGSISNRDLDQYLHTEFFQSRPSTINKMILQLIQGNGDGLKESFTTLLSYDDKLEYIEEIVAILGDPVRPYLFDKAFYINFNHCADYKDKKIPTTSYQSIAVLRKLLETYSTNIKSAEYQKKRKSFIKFEKAVKEKKAFIGTPRHDSPGIQSFYATITNAICSIVAAIDKKIKQLEKTQKDSFIHLREQNNPQALSLQEEMERLFTLFEDSFSYCGTRIISDVIDTYDLVVDSQPVTIENRIQKSLSDRRKFLLQDICPGEQNVHFYSYLMKTCGKKWGVPGYSDFANYSDPTFSPENHEQEISDLSEKFETSYSSSYALIEYVKSTLADTKTGELFQDYLVAHHPKAWDTKTKKVLFSTLEAIYVDTTKSKKEQQAIAREHLKNAPYFYTATDEELESLDKLKEGLEAQFTSGVFYMGMNSFSASTGKTFSYHSIVTLLMNMKIVLELPSSRN